jgi:hypothetical protein
MAQIFFFAVLLQALALFFLMFVHSFMLAKTSQKEPMQQIKIVPANQVVAERQSSAPERQSSAPERQSSAPDIGKRQSAEKVENEGFFVGNSVIVEQEPFPKINVVLINQTKLSQVVTGIKLIVVEYSPYASIPQPQILSSIAVIDFDLPYGTGSYDFNLETPLRIASDDALTLTFRLSVPYRGEKIPPKKVAGYKVKFLLRTATGLRAETETFSI